MKLLFFGDSITDMHREKNCDNTIYSYGACYTFIVASELFRKNPNEHQVISRGIGGSRTVDLYARIKKDVWNEQPDVLTILIGVNDVWHELMFGNGVTIDRYEKVYRMIIEETMVQCPNTKIVLMEPFVLHGHTTDLDGNFPFFAQVFDYAKVVKKLADEYKLSFVPLQAELDKKAAEFGPEPYLYDGVHPMVAGATLIADEWMKVFDKEINK